MIAIAKQMTIFGAVLGSLLVWAGGAAAEERFADLQYSKWAEDSITYMAERGTAAGYGNGIFKPEGVVTRAQAVTFMVRELYPQQLQQGAEGTAYSDVPTTHPFYREIAIAASNGLAGGFPDGTFHPDAPISRAETAAFLIRAYSRQATRKFDGYSNALGGSAYSHHELQWFDRRIFGWHLSCGSTCHAREVCRIYDASDKRAAAIGGNRGSQAFSGAWRHDGRLSFGNAGADAQTRPARCDGTKTVPGTGLLLPQPRRSRRSSSRSSWRKPQMSYRRRRKSP